MEKKRLLPRKWLKNGWGRDVSTRGSRIFAYLNTLLMDHGIIRFFWKNFDRVGTDVYRTNQPLPKDLAYYQRKYKIATIINLRGKTDFSYFRLEERSCAALGLKLVSIPFRSRALPLRSSCIALLDALENAPRPILFHCKSGADRTGLAAIIYLIAFEGQPFEKAKKQLNWRYGHLGISTTRAMDVFFTTWQDAHKKSGIKLADWIKDGYNPDEIPFLPTAKNRA